MWRGFQAICEVFVGLFQGWDCTFKMAYLKVFQLSCKFCNSYGPSAAMGVKHRGLGKCQAKPPPVFKNGKRRKLMRRGRCPSNAVMLLTGARCLS